jgi:DNA-binding GntR family transcriptional regulator
MTNEKRAMTEQFDLGKTNYQRVRDILRNDIITGLYPEGARLKVSELVSRYGVSAMPIREALHQLQGEGLIVLSANRGASVRKIDEDSLWKIYEIRKSLELYFVRELGGRAAHQEIDRLRSMLDEQDSAVAAADEELLQQLDRDFHSSIVRSTGNEEAVAILHRSYNLTRPLRLRFGRSPEQRQGITRDHRAIVDAIARSEGNIAAELMSAHINKAFIDLANVMRLEDDTIRTRLKA